MIVTYITLLFKLLLLLVSHGQRLDCYDEKSCQDYFVVTNDTYSFTQIRCWGYFSCAFVVPFETDTAVSCEGSYSCYGASSIVSTASSIYCSGLSSCENVGYLRPKIAEWYDSIQVNCEGERYILYFSLFLFL